jgi:hypothetical protein
MNNLAESSELLVHLQRGIRQSRQLAEELTRNSQVSDEARALLTRLQAIAAELEAMKALEVSLRQVENDPIWPKPRWHN